jgi:hypothetical protein
MPANLARGKFALSQHTGEFAGTSSIACRSAPSGIEKNQTRTFPLEATLEIWIRKLSCEGIAVFWRIEFGIKLELALKLRTLKSLAQPNSLTNRVLNLVKVEIWKDTDLVIGLENLSTVSPDEGNPQPLKSSTVNQLTFGGCFVNLKTRL